MFRYNGQRILNSVICTVLGERQIYVGATQYNVNYYEALGLAKGSTQTEIKTAYYKLSMLYHPDKNQGSDSAAKKFREITQAYEVLGNYRLRRLYDKGIIHTAGSQYTQHTDIRDDIAPDVEDDPETKFYKSRFQKSKVADIKGRTPIYDFDEWSRAHYGKSFDRKQAAKAKYDRLKNQKADSIKSTQNDIVMLSILFICFAVYMMFVAESSLDTPTAKKQQAEARHAERFKQENEVSNNET